MDADLQNGSWLSLRQHEAGVPDCPIYPKAVTRGLSLNDCPDGWFAREAAASGARDGPRGSACWFVDAAVTACRRLSRIRKSARDCTVADRRGQCLVGPCARRIRAGTSGSSPMQGAALGSGSRVSLSVQGACPIANSSKHSLCGRADDGSLVSAQTGGSRRAAVAYRAASKAVPPPGCARPLRSSDVCERSGACPRVGVCQRTQSWSISTPSWGLYW